MQNKNPYDLFKNFTFLDNTVLKGKLPNEIFLELQYMVEQSKYIKNHSLAHLKNHLNVGKNSYQISINLNLINNSFIYPYLNYLGEYYIHKVTNKPLESLYRKVTLRENRGHFDGFDIWINYGYKGDVNPMHNHGGTLSGVIYIQNDFQIPTKFITEIEHKGTSGDIVIFPSDLLHEVEELKETQERITVAFNLNYIE